MQHVTTDWWGVRVPLGFRVQGSGLGFAGVCKVLGFTLRLPFRVPFRVPKTGL